ncbi:unnamed protein product [Chrysoparadoxa australica]
MPVLQLLLQYGAEVDATTNYSLSPLVLATRHRHKDCALKLIQAGCDVNIRGGGGGLTALHEASRLGQLTVVQALLTAKADPDIESSAGETPASWCSRCWQQHPIIYANIPEEQRQEVLAALHRRSLAAALWRGRRVVVLLQARHGRGQSIWEGSVASPAEASLRHLMLWLVQRPNHGMLPLFRLIVSYL